jgi:hypothetical protein
VRIIFLDFDGVILPLPSDGHFELNLEVSDEAIKNLNILVQLSEAKVVVSSAWRLTRTPKQLKELLTSWGFKGEVAGKTTSSFGDEDRGADILHWLSHSTEMVESYVILDDDPTDLGPLAKHLVSVKPDVGLQFHDVLEASRILGGIQN